MLVPAPCTPTKASKLITLVRCHTPVKLGLRVLTSTTNDDAATAADDDDDDDDEEVEAALPGTTP